MASPLKYPEQGSIYTIKLDEQDGLGVVISSSASNAVRQVCLVCPIVEPQASLPFEQMPTMAKLELKDTNAGRELWVAGGVVHTVLKRQFVSLTGWVRHLGMQKIWKALHTTLGEIPWPD